MSKTNTLSKKTGEGRELLRSQDFEERKGRLAIAVHQGLANLSYETRSQESLAMYAGHQLSNAESAEMELRWFRECCSIAKQGSASASNKTLQLVDDLDYESESFKAESI